MKLLSSTQASKIPLQLLQGRRMCHHQPQDIGGYTEQRCGNAIIVVTVHPAMNTPLQSVHHI